MELGWTVCLAVSVCSWLVSSERHSVYWNSTNPKGTPAPREQNARPAQQEDQWVRFVYDYAVKVKLNDYLDIVCPHYPQGEAASQDAERYVLYMVEREDYDACKPQSYDQMRWECSHPFAQHVPEKFSEKFQRFTPFTLGKEFRQAKPLHHHGQDCLQLRVDVIAADDNDLNGPDVQKSTHPIAGAACPAATSLAVLSLLGPVSLLLLLLH
ncbi:hypothetical protein NHX12_023810 [Muraenolepis orangiensis]|uniref:Ephrin-A1 n=1 Tax=Muraenolepis orangiensis TaxID=630683 RepID=A0A9Q0ERP4_9TELE|nr:hypothetical protein NHX12_023810 [Muraenolepis orangiensis]